MALLILPGQTTQQPQYPARIDRGNPLGARVLSAFFGGRNVLTEQEAVWSGTRATGEDAQGRMTSLDGSSYLDLSAAGLFNDGTRPVTICYFSKPLAAPTYAGVLRVAPIAAANEFVILRGANGTGYDFTVGNAPGTTPVFAVPARTNGVAERVVVVASQGMQSSTFAQYAVWINRIKYTSVGTVNYTAQPNSGTSYFGWDGPDSKWAGLLDELVIFESVLSDSDIASYYDNPWQIFIAPPRRIWIPAAGGGTAALAGASATGASGSSGVTHSQPTSGSASTSSAGATGASVTVVLSGATATGAAGTLVATASWALAGQAAAASAGTVSTGADAATGLTGAAVTASAGTAGVSLSLAVVGASAGSAVGAVGIARTTAVSGAAATGAAGSAGVSIATAIAGSASTASAGTVGTTGNASAALSGAVVSASSGALGVSSTYAITGQSASASAGAVSATAGSGAALDGSQAASAAGTVARSIAVGLSGAACAVSAGGLSLSQVLAGSQIVVTPGAFGAAVALQLTGASAYAYAGIVAGSGGDGGADVQYPLAGLTQGHPLAGLHQGYPLEEQTQMYPLAGLR